MNETQQPTVTALWEPVSGLVEAVHRMELRRALPYVVPASALETLLDVFGVGGLVPLFHTHVTGGGHYPSRVARASPVEAYLEVGRCRDTQQPRATTWAYTSLRVQQTPDAAWLVADLRPTALGAQFSRHDLEQALAARSADETVLKLLSGRLYMKPRKNVTLDAVETSLVEGMPKAQFGLLEQARALTLWRDYVRGGGDFDQDAAPAWAAAIEQIVANLNGRHLSTPRAAHLYEVTGSAVDERRMTLATMLAIEDMDERYIVFDVEPASDDHGSAAIVDTGA
jgi:hypothetical protein